MQERTKDFDVKATKYTEFIGRDRTDSYEKDRWALFLILSDTSTTDPTKEGDLHSSTWRTT